MIRPLCLMGYFFQVLGEEIIPAQDRWTSVWKREGCATWDEKNVMYIIELLSALQYLARVAALLHENHIQLTELTTVKHTQYLETYELWCCLWSGEEPKLSCRTWPIIWWTQEEYGEEMNNFVLVLFHWEQQSNNNYQERMATGIHALSTYLSAALSQEVQTSQVISCNQMPLPSCPEMFTSLGFNQVFWVSWVCYHLQKISERTPSIKITYCNHNCIPASFLYSYSLVH